MKKLIFPLCATALLPLSSLAAANDNCGCEGEASSNNPAMTNPDLHQYVLLRNQASTPRDNAPLLERHSACKPCEKHWSLTLQSGLLSAYENRGIVHDADPVNQSSVTAAYHVVDDDTGTDWGTFGAQWWGNTALTNDGKNGVNTRHRHAGRLTENAWSVFWSHSLGDDFSITLGHTYYDYSELMDSLDDRNTAEVYTKLSMPGAWLKPFVAAYYDYQDADGWYLQGGVEHSFKLADLDDKEASIKDDVTFDLGSTIGWASSNYAESFYGQNGHSSLTDLSIQAGFTIPFLRGDSYILSFKPFVKWFTTLDRVDDNDIYGAGDSYNRSGFVGGASISLEF